MNDFHDRAVSTDYLETRLDLNRKYQSTDFDAWLMARLGVRPGESILDVGCGTGAQTVPFLEQVGSGGFVCALDIARDSVAQLVARVGPSANLATAVADMADLDNVIAREFPRKAYDLAHSSYALYYCPERLRVLDVMRRHLKPAGRVAIFSPNLPHGMVELARKFGPIPAEVEGSLRFGPAVLEPYFRAHFWDVTVQFFHNVVRVPSADDAVAFYRSTTYYREDAEAGFRASVLHEIEAKGVWEYEKNGYLIIGARPVDATSPQ
ncbi:MAG: class I SAM-dependent methyltransferase [Burkholderiales bacterium]